MQQTIRSPIRLRGVGLHSGQRVRMSLRPAPAEHGIWFRRSDVHDRPAMVPALWDAVEPGALCTRIVNEAGVSVSTVEHLMAALAGCGVQNALVEIDGPEVPIMDGSALPFVRAILGRGVRRQDAPVRAFDVQQMVEVRSGDAWARLEPAAGFEMSFDIDFPDAAIGRQRRAMSLANGAFVHHLCDSRTFCRAADIATMRASGLALGGTYDNAVVVDGAHVLSPGGLRHRDEAVRHKMLDAMGDLALAGAPLLARYTGHRAGHALTNRLLRALFAQPGAVRIIDVDPRQAATLPGAHVVREDAPQAA